MGSPCMARVDVEVPFKMDGLRVIYPLESRDQPLFTNYSHGFLTLAGVLQEPECEFQA